VSAIAIRKMRPEDDDRIVAILSHWNMAPVPATPERPDSEIAAIEIGNTFVASADGKIVGVASYVLHGERRAETEILAVDPAWRGIGIGTRLQTARLAEMKARGVKQVRTKADRPETIAWYVRKFGYRIAGTAPKKHAFGLEGVDRWTVLELDL